MGAQDLSLLSMILAFAAVLVSVGVYAYLRIGLYKEYLVAVLRMTVQLLFVGLYLSAIFKLNNPYINIGYVLLMTGVANYSLLRNSGLRLTLFTTTYPALVIGMGSVLLFYMVAVFSPEPLFDAKYVIPIAGMLLGNSMTRTIVTLERFYSSIRKDSEGFASLVTMGGTVREAMMPYLREAYRSGIAPTLANIATIGLVSLPGMMTGQILGGSEPFVAIKYQIAIILAILAATELSTLLTIFFSLQKGFDRAGFLKWDIFKTY